MGLVRNYAVVLTVALATGLFVSAAQADSSCVGADEIPQQNTLTKARKATFCLMNQERLNAGVPVLKQNGRLRRAAAKHSRNMVKRHFFDHVTPEKRTELDRLKRSHYVGRDAHGYIIGENIYSGAGDLATPAAVIAAWMNSSGHRKIMLSGSFTEVGIGIAPGPVTVAVPALFRAQDPLLSGGTYTADFGNLSLT